MRHQHPHDEEALFVRGTSHFGLRKLRWSRRLCELEHVDCCFRKLFGLRLLALRQLFIQREYCKRHPRLSIEGHLQVSATGSGSTDCIPYFEAALDARPANFMPRYLRIDLQLTRRCCGELVELLIAESPTPFSSLLSSCRVLEDFSRSNSSSSVFSLPIPAVSSPAFSLSSDRSFLILIPPSQPIHFCACGPLDRRMRIASPRKPRERLELAVHP